MALITAFLRVLSPVLFRSHLLLEIPRISARALAFTLQLLLSCPPASDHSVLEPGVEIMRLLDVHSFDGDAGKPQMKEFIGSSIPDYAILSHTWGNDEVSFSDIITGTAHRRKAFSKLLNTILQAKALKLDWVWIDTCCIDKSSSADLQESINSMFKWYEKTTICLAYLEDVVKPSGEDSWKKRFRASRWFTRGWTLQELLAPGLVYFFSQQWKVLIWIDRRWRSAYNPPHDKYVKLVSEASGIDEAYVGGRIKIEDASIATRMSWASGRLTTREEDQAYSLLGLFKVNMPLLYGEGKNAFIRLQEEIMRRSDDMSIFYWKFVDGRRNLESEERRELPLVSEITGLLAPACEHFYTSSTAQAGPIEKRSLSTPFEMTNKGLKVDMPLVQVGDNLYFSVLDCNDSNSFFPTQTSSQASEQSIPFSVGICLCRMYDGTNQFLRAYPGRTISLQNIEGIQETIFVRQTLNGPLPSDRLKLADTPLRLDSIRIQADEDVQQHWTILGRWQREYPY